MDIPLLISSLSAAKTLGGALLDERDRQKAAAIQIQLTEKIIQAQAQLSEVLGTIISKDEALHALRERVRELERAERERDRYRLAKLGVAGDFFAYQLRPTAELTERGDEPPHFLCQPCFDAGKKSVLSLNDTFAICPICKTQTRIKPAKPISYGGGRGFSGF